MFEGLTCSLKFLPTLRACEEKKKKKWISVHKIYMQLIFDILGKWVAMEKRGWGACSAHFFTSLFIYVAIISPLTCVQVLVWYLIAP